MKNSKKYKDKHKKYLHKNNNGGNLEVFNRMDNEYWHNNYFLMGRLFDLYFDDTKSKRILELIKNRYNYWLQYRNKFLKQDEIHLGNLWFPIEETIISQDEFLNENEKNILYMEIFSLFMKYVNQFTEEELKKFGDYLLNSHHTMQYGIYFSIQKKKNNSQISISYNTELRTVTIDLDLFLNYILHECEKIGINIRNVVYVNLGWEYGRLLNTTIRFENKIKFMDNIIEVIDSNNLELICKIPIDFNKLKTHINSKIYQMGEFKF